MKTGENLLTDLGNLGYSLDCYTDDEGFQSYGRKNIKGTLDNLEGKADSLVPRGLGIDTHLSNLFDQKWVEQHYGSVYDTYDLKPIQITLLPVKDPVKVPAEYRTKEKKAKGLFSFLKAPESEQVLISEERDYRTSDLLNQVDTDEEVRVCGWYLPFLNGRRGYSFFKLTAVMGESVAKECEEMIRSDPSIVRRTGEAIFPEMFKALKTGERGIASNPVAYEKLSEYLAQNTEDNPAK